MKKPFWTSFLGIEISDETSYKELRNSFFTPWYLGESKRSHQNPLYIIALQTFHWKPYWLFPPSQTCIWSENKSVVLKLPSVTNRYEDLTEALGSLPRKKCTYMQSCNITLKGSYTPGSILIKNEKEELHLFIINTVVIGTLHTETISLWFSGRPSLSTRVRTKILFFVP